MLARSEFAPVVVGVTESETSLLALRRAASEAAQRASPLHVIAGGPPEVGLASVAEDERERHTISSILRMPQVTISIVDDTSPETLATYCMNVAASLLVIGCDDRAGEADLESPATTHRLVDEARCDVLVVHAPQGVGTATHLTG
jgi:nucleotide-binding universal stress UspA family protein